jgi:hypothetical protein
MNNSDLDRTIKKLRQLDRLSQKLSTMCLAPKNTWISQYTVPRYYPKTDTTHYYTYAKWESIEPIFECKPKRNYATVDLNIEEQKYTRHRHIGRVSSTSELPMDVSVQLAYRELRNRRWLDRVESAIAKVQSAISEF